MSSKWLALAEEERKSTDPHLTFDKTDKTQPKVAKAEFCQVLSKSQADEEGKSVERADPSAALAEILSTSGTPATSATHRRDTEAKVATLHPENQPNDMLHGFAVNDNPKTWTGNVVSLDDWRGLSEWQRHGPNGRMWCGVCRTWVSQCEHTRGEDV